MSGANRGPNAYLRKPSKAEQDDEKRSGTKYLELLIGASIGFDGV
jgi:hypothetical protein